MGIEDAFTPLCSGIRKLGHGSRKKEIFCIGRLRLRILKEWPSFRATVATCVLGKMPKPVDFVRVAQTLWTRTGHVRVQSAFEVTMSHAEHRISTSVVPLAAARNPWKKERTNTPPLKIT